MINDLLSRRTIRLKGYDYSKPGLYFVTICAQNREYLFGEIEDGIMVLNDAGKMIEKWYQELEIKYPDIKCHAKIVMPNHFHCIVENIGFSVGADLCVCPDKSIEGEHIGSPLHMVVQWFKTMTTNEYIRGVNKYDWKSFNKRIWQRNYYEHIIRNEDEYNHICEYIEQNPLKWEFDNMNIENTNISESEIPWRV